MPHVVTLKRSQVPMARELADYITARLAGDDRRPACLVAMGNRGGGKTWLLALFIVAIALAMPGAWQMCVNLNSKNKMEVEDAIKQVVAPRWIKAEVKNFFDPKILFCTEGGLLWMTSKNPGAMRMGQLKFEHVLINEAQDQSAKIFSNAFGAIRTGGCVSLATNGSQGLGGDWVVVLYQTIQGGQHQLNEYGGADGKAFFLDNKDNDVVDQATMTKGGRLVRAVDPEAAAVDFDGVIKLSGDLGYPGFNRLPYRLDAELRPVGGHVGEPPNIGWEDVTRELTRQKAGSGFDYIGLSDFQKNPGCCVVIAKIYRDHRDELVLYCVEFVTVQGREAELTQALIDRRYFPAGVDLDERPASSLLIVGDATGDRQSASHRRQEPYSWIAMRAAGDWTIVPPDRFWKSRLPRNPEVDDSRKQMHSLFLNHQILISPKCDETPREQTHDGVAAFPSLIEGFARTKVYPSGAFVKRGHFTHGPDGVRYGAWCFMPRPTVTPKRERDNELAASFRSIRLTDR